MHTMTRPSGAWVPSWDLGRPSPVVLRLLPRVHHPPARVLVPGCGPGHEARALDARGYRVTAMDLPGRGPDDLPVVHADFLDADFDSEALGGGGFDLVCEHAYFCSIHPVARARYVTAVAKALRPGGKLFGAFLQFDEPGRTSPPWGVSASELIALLSGAFDVEHLETSSFPFHLAGATQIEAIFTRR